MPSKPARTPLEAAAESNGHMPPVLCISRNKHLKHISAYHGPWLRLDNNILAELLEVNAAARRPLPIYQAVLEDLRGIKKLVEEAIGLSVRATNQQSVVGRGKISKERQRRVLSLAVSKMAAAYSMNEVAASVATMQSASVLEEIAVKILRKDPEDLDALYVHFFHERIPSRQLAESTTLESLNLLIRSRPLEAHLLRTRATVLTFKDEHFAAIKDMTSALSLVEYNKKHGQGGSLESQLLYMRGESYLTLAIRAASSFLESGKEDLKKKVRQYARRAIRDILKFCSLFEYTPNLRQGHICSISSLFDASSKKALLTIEGPASTSITKEEIARRVAIARAKQALEASPSSTQKSSEITQVLSSAQADQDRTALTYHPLLPDCLHSLLLSHVLASTPAPEIKRHAEQVLHLSKICDGYPVFLTPRSSARSDWTELLRRQGHLLIGLSAWTGPGISSCGTSRGPSQTDTKEYPISDRAGVISEWVSKAQLDSVATDDTNPGPCTKTIESHPQPLQDTLAPKEESRTPSCGSGVGELPSDAITVHHKDVVNEDEQKAGLLAMHMNTLALQSTDLTK